MEFSHQLYVKCLSVAIVVGGNCSGAWACLPKSCRDAVSAVVSDGIRHGIRWYPRGSRWKLCAVCTHLYNPRRSRWVPRCGSSVHFFVQFLSALYGTGLNSAVVFVLCVDARISVNSAIHWLQFGERIPFDNSDKLRMSAILTERGAIYHTN